MPILDEIANVVVSNCVLNLLPKKDKIFQEIYRVLVPGGHFSISDIVLRGSLPEALTDAAEMYAGCVAGAIQKSDYIKLINKAGFENVTIQKEKSIHIPDDILKNYLDADSLSAFRSGETGIFSITVFGSKKGSKMKELDVLSNADYCPPGSGCC